MFKSLSKTRTLLGGTRGRGKGGGENENLGERNAVVVLIFFFFNRKKLVNPSWVNQKNCGLWMQPTATILKFEILRFQKFEGIQIPYAISRKIKG
jgi:hypothetical protein